MWGKKPVQNQKVSFCLHLLIGLAIIGLAVFSLYFLETGVGRSITTQGGSSSRAEAGPEGWARFRPRGEDSSILVRVQKIERDGREYLYIVNKKPKKPDYSDYHQEPMKNLSPP